MQQIIINYSCNKYLLDSCFMLGTVLGTGDIVPSDKTHSLLNSSIKYSVRNSFGIVIRDWRQTDKKQWLKPSVGSRWYIWKDHTQWTKCGCEHRLRSILKMKVKWPRSGSLLNEDPFKKMLRWGNYWCIWKRPDYSIFMAHRERGICIHERI